jgi:ATP-dependent helicase/nuclease subunit B
MPAVVVARGARAVQDRLLRDLATLFCAAEGAADRCARPVRVVVPSRSLRDHIGAAIVRHTGRAVAGIQLHTLHGLARDVLERTGRPAPSGEELLPVLVSRCARFEETLREGLEPLHEGYAALTGTVTDLLDAGFDAVHAAALDEALCEFASRRERRSRDERSVARMRALVRVAAEVVREFSRLRLGRASTRLLLAREAIERNPDAALPARGVLVHGFAEATSEASALIEALCRHCDATVYIDHPADPANPEQLDFGIRFTQRLRERLLGTARLTQDNPPETPPPSVEILRAGEGQSEVRAVADRVRRLLDGASPPRPEEIGIVARTLRPYARALRMHLQRLAIPFSSSTAEAPRGPAGRRVDALFELLRLRDALSVDSWLDVRGDLTPEGRCDLRVALHSLGAARLGAVAALVPGRDFDPQKHCPLPVYRGLAQRRETSGEPLRRSEPQVSALPRIVTFESLEAAVQAARRLCQGLEARLQNAPLAEHLADFRRLLREVLASPIALLEDALGKLERSFPPDLPMSAEEFLSLLEGVVASDQDTLGGNGAGVQVLDAMAARGRTFSHLFVLGMNRDVFPRVVLEDPFLPDAARRALLPVLPDLALKETGFAEERYLFAQLLSSSPRVTLSWQVADDDGKPMAPSPLVQRMRSTLGRKGPELVPSLYSPPTGSDFDLRPAHELAVLAGLYGGWRSFARVLPIAIRERLGAGRAGVDASQLARTRIAILREFDPWSQEEREGASLLGPYFGFVGALRETADPRRRPLYVTAAEQLNACPWQAFLRRFLRIQAPPDALGDLPGIDARLVGATVHTALEDLAVLQKVPARLLLEEAVAAGGAPLSWPDRDALPGILQAAAEKVCRAEGIALPGYAQALASLAQTSVEAAESAEGGRTLDVLGVEVDGACSVLDAAGRPRTVRFRADRVDREHNTLRLTDYKVGRPISELKTWDKRARDFLRAVRRGDRLQAVAYALAAAELGGSAAEARGRYLFLTEDLAAREFEVAADDRMLADAFREALRATFAVLDAGSFFPRLLEPDRSGPKRCEYCEVHEACLRGDSGSRLRLERWAAAQSEGLETSPSPAEQAAFAVWQLRAETNP